MKCVRLKNDKISHIKKGDVENMAATVSDMVNKKNDHSPQNREYLLSSTTSTPLRNMHSTNAEESPDIDHYPSPIFPCTQEGGNEVAWDWQSSLNKTPESRNQRRNVQFETPKGTKLFQKKRNSNSPLLYKPLKRKTIKMENIENIGQFAAELQALDERVRFIKQTDRNPVEESPPIVADTSDKEEVTRIQDKGQDCIREIDNRDNAGQNDASGSYDDLFDDSIDDCMARCTQEVEEKFNLITDKGDSQHSQTSVKKEELPSSKLPSDNKITPVQFTSNESTKEPSSVRNFLHKSISDSNTLRTYSKLSLKRDANSSTHVPVQKEQNLHKSHMNNNNTLRSHPEKSCDDDVTLAKSNITELFNIPDDSFDDCLATCVEDEKLLPNWFDDFSSHKNDSTKYRGNCKYLINAPLKSEGNSTGSVKTAARDETSNSTLLQSRKFFKTKSLSDQYIGQDAIASGKNTSNASSASYFTTRSKLHSNSSRTITHTSVARGSVSSNPIVTNAECKIKDSAISLMRDTGRTHGSNVNRCAGREGGERFSRYNSTDSMRNNTRETMRGGSQPARCTAEEIEQKRLQAKMRLEARKRLYSLKINNNINR